MRKLRISAKRIGARPRAAASRWASWSRAFVSRLTMRNYGRFPVDMTWRKASARAAADARTYVSQFRTIRPTVQLHVTLAPRVKTVPVERVTERRFERREHGMRFERRTLLERSRTDRLETRTEAPAPDRRVFERLTLLPAAPAPSPSWPSARREQPRSRVGVAHGFTLHLHSQRS